MVAIVVWMAGMFSMAHRLAAETDDNSDIPRLRALDERWTVGAMAVAWVLGFWMASQARWWVHAWFVAKFLLVLAMSGLHGSMASALRRRLDRPDSAPPRWHSHAPGVLFVALALIAILVVVKPA